jgi:hypothetical protein
MRAVWAATDAYLATITDEKLLEKRQSSRWGKCPFKRHRQYASPTASRTWVRSPTSVASLASREWAGNGRQLCTPACMKMPLWMKYSGPYIETASQ